MTDVYIVDAVRTPIGRYGGAPAGSAPTTWRPPSSVGWSTARGAEA